MLVVSTLFLPLQGYSSISSTFLPPSHLFSPKFISLLFSTAYSGLKRSQGKIYLLWEKERKIKDYLAKSKNHSDFPQGLLCGKNVTFSAFFSLSSLGKAKLM
jgi:hypothetical protein